MNLREHFKEAAQFFKDQKPWPEGVYQLGVYEPDKVTRKDRYYLRTPDGEVEIYDGDWIVQTFDNKKYFVRVTNEKVE